MADAGVELHVHDILYLLLSLLIYVRLRLRVNICCVILLRVLQRFLDVDVDVHLRCISFRLFLVEPDDQDYYEEYGDIVRYEIEPNVIDCLRLLDVHRRVKPLHFLILLSGHGLQIVEENQVVFSDEYLPKNVICIVQLLIGAFDE